MYTTIFIIYVLSPIVAFGHMIDIQISSECREQFIRQTRLRDQCQNRLTTANQFNHDFNTTVIKFSGNDNDLPAVETFFARYCDLMPLYLQCFEISDDVSAVCRTQIPNRQMKMIIFDVLSSLARYACENDAAMLKKLLPYDGFKFLFLNDDLDRCVAVINDFATFNDLCLSLDRSLPCFEKLTANHRNKDLIVVVREVLNRFKSAGNCEM